MPMLDVQKRHAEVFRLRMGEKGAKGQPVKLTDAIRITSYSEDVVVAFTDVYGGEVVPWAGAPNGEQYQAKLPTTELSIMVLPGQSLDQWWELYRGSVCERRCDGYTETLSGKDCVCPSDIAQRLKATGACRPMTRLHVLCPDVEVVGAGTLVTHGMIAAETLPQSVAVAEAALKRGLMVPGTLRVVEHKGKKHYIVPQIEIVGVSLQALTSGEAPERLALQERTPVTPAPRGEIAAPAQRGIPAPSSAPERAGAPSTSARSTVSGGGVQVVVDKSTAQAKTPAAPTGSSPVDAGGTLPLLPDELDGGAGEAATTAPPAADDFRTALTDRALKLPPDLRRVLAAKRAERDLPKVDEALPEHEAALTKLLVAVEKEATGRAKSIVLACKRAGLESDEDRHALVSYCTDGRIDSAKALTEEEAARVTSAAKDVQDGALVMVVSEDGTTFLPGGTEEA